MKCIYCNSENARNADYYCSNKCYRAAVRMMAYNRDDVEDKETYDRVKPYYDLDLELNNIYKELADIKRANAIINKKSNKKPKKIRDIKTVFRKIYVDGSSSGVDCAICVKYNGESPVIKTFNKGLSSIEMEYRAILCALKELKKIPIDVKNSFEKTIFTDSMQIYNELNGIYTPKDNKFYDQALELLDGRNIKIEWVSRNYNLAGIKLENRLNKIKTNAKRVSSPWYYYNQYH